MYFCDKQKGGAMILIEEFQSGHYEQGIEYKYFVPNQVHDEWGWQTPAIGALLERAARKLGELNSFARFVPNIELFIKLHVTHEAVISSRIEGTKTQMDEALLPETEIEPEGRDDWQEVNNYVTAMNEAIESLKALPISSRLIKNTHKVLLNSVRGEHKLPGTYRTSQNWIGGHSLADARYIPPHATLLGDLMGDLEKFLNESNDSVPALIKIAIAHYQFETIHPFLDGNGRMGRLLITLFLVEQGILEQPLLYMSSYFEKDKTLYYDNLNNVRVKNDMLQWIKYFLVGIEQTATLAVDRLKKVLELKVSVETEIRTTYGRRSASALSLLQYLFQHPTLSIDEAATACALSIKAAGDLVRRMQESEILTEITKQSRNRLFCFERYLALFR